MHIENGVIAAKAAIESLLTSFDNSDILEVIDSADGLIMRRRGYDDGKSAAGWIVDGNTPDPLSVLTRLIKGMEDGDPAVMDDLPHPRLAGEYADDPTITTIAADELNRPYDEGDDVDQLYDAYTSGWSEGVEAEIKRMYKAYTD